MRRKCATIVHMRRKATKEELIADIVDVLVHCDWTTLRVLWEVAGFVDYAREKFSITYTSMSYHIPIQATYDEKNQVVSLHIYAPKKQKPIAQTSKR